MDNVSNTDIYRALMDIKEDIGGLNATVKGHQETLAKHIVDDALLAKDVSQIQLSLARQKGAIRAWGLVATGAASFMGAIFQLFKH